MSARLPFTQMYEALPDTLPVFPLGSAVVLPGSELPLNIFEPRYLNMVQDALGGHHLIGMIQPRDASNTPELHDVGCAGRISRYQETRDGRIELVLTGVCRFRIDDELPTTRGYRLVTPNWQEFAGDYDQPAVSKATARDLNSALRHYLESRSLQIDNDVLDSMEAVDIANNLISSLPFSVGDKQLLLEASGVDARIKALSALLRRDVGVALVH